MGTIISDKHPLPEESPFICWRFDGWHQGSFADSARWHDVLTTILDSICFAHGLGRSEETRRAPAQLEAALTRNGQDLTLIRFYNPYEDDSDRLAALDVAQTRRDLHDRQRQMAMEFADRTTEVTLDSMPLCLGRLVIPPADLEIQPGQLWVPDYAELVVASAS